MSRRTVVAEDGVATVDETDELPEDNQLIRYDEAGRAVQLDPFEALLEQGGDFDLAATPSIADRLAEAKKPVQVSAVDIMGHDVVWMAWRPQNALLTNEGTITEGYFALARDLTSERYITIFVGGIALCRTLRQLNQPFRARLEKHGRTLVFV